LINPFVARGVTDRRFKAGARYDFIVANILPHPLVGMATPLVKLLASNGVLVLSGIIPQHANFVVNSYSARGVTLTKRDEHEGWVTLTFKR
jgi:ribosomal protein L11 methyltransferase